MLTPNTGTHDVSPPDECRDPLKNHRPALGGMKFAVGAAVVLLVALVIWLVVAGNVQDGAETQIDGRTGEVLQAE